MEVAEARVAFGMRDSLLVQCKEVIEILREQLSEERRLRAKVQSELIAEKRQSDQFESEKSLLEGRVEELTKQVQSLQDHSFLDNKKRGMLETRIEELVETLKITQTKNEELTAALASSQSSLQGTVRKLGTSEGAVFRDLQARYNQCKASEQELMQRLEAVLQDNQRLNRELMAVERPSVTSRKSGEMERKSWADIGEVGQSQKAPFTLRPEVTTTPLPRVLSSPRYAEPTVRSPLSPAAALVTPFHFETELEKQKQEHEELLQRLHFMVKERKPGQKAAL
jgi:chromosome segregation ATPase